MAKKIRVRHRVWKGSPDSGYYGWKDGLSPEGTFSVYGRSNDSYPIVYKEGLRLWGELLFCDIIDLAYCHHVVGSGNDVANLVKLSVVAKALGDSALEPGALPWADARWRIVKHLIAGAGAPLPWGGDKLRESYRAELGYV